MIGSKGIPASFGGIERHVEEVSARLASAGHEVTVYGRKPFSESCVYRGVRVKNLPSIRTKNLDAATNSFLATIHALFGEYDIIHYHGVGPSLFCHLGRLSPKKTVSTIHAPDYKQVKWGPFARFMLRQGEKTAATVPDASIAVSRLMTERLNSEPGRKVRYIPNGATIRPRPDFTVGSELGLESGKYILAVGRFIYEKGFHDLIDAYSGIDSGLRLVLAGDEKSADSGYRDLLRSRSDSRTVFAGFQSGGNLDQLYAHCRFYVLPSYVEGLPITLIEAMSFGCPLLISDIPENMEAAGSIAATFRSGDSADLEAGLIRMISMNEAEREIMSRKARERVEKSYNWDLITGKIEKIYYEIKKVL
ncbi:MAG: glycosyltransferase family 4 protein [Candidatus Krumholzibacteriales bacterium]